METVDDLQFVKLGAEGVRTLVNWAEAEGWNPGEHDADVFYATDPDGFYGYYSGGELIAGGSIVSYNGDFGFMGFFIVRPEFRARGIGRKLWYQRRDVLLGRLKEGASIGMDGVAAMQPFYRQGGFVIAFRDERYKVKGTAFQLDQRITVIKEHDIEAILEYDAKCFGFPRPQFMKPWLKMPGVRAFKYEYDGMLKGFVILRKVKTGYKICPLFADDATIAEELYKACLTSATGEPVYIDIPVINQAAQSLVRKYDATYVFECARMYYGKPPAFDINKIFGITTFELG